MKKILCLVLFVGFAFPQETGNNFLNEYPFGKNREEVMKSGLEMQNAVKYISIIQGVIGGNAMTLAILRESRNVSQLPYVYGDVFELHNRICSMTNEQMVRIVKK